MLKELFGKATITPLERDLLDSVRESAIPSPDVLRGRQAALTQQIAKLEADWGRLDRRGDAAAFLALTPIAERLQALRAEAAPLPAAIESAERRRAAFLALVRLFEAVAADVSARTCALLEHPPQDSREREGQLRALDQATRIHGRLAGRLAAISASRQFRDPPDALKSLRVDLELRIQEFDLLRVPGSKPRLEWPTAMIELLDVLEDRTSRKETA